MDGRTGAELDPKLCTVALYVTLSASQGMRASFPGSPTGHLTSGVQYGFPKKSGSNMKCQPVRCAALRNELASDASWNWLNVSESDMIRVWLRGICVNGTSIGAVAGAGEASVAGTESVGVAPPAPVGRAAGTTGTACVWQAAARAAIAPLHATSIERRVHLVIMSPPPVC